MRVRVVPYAELRRLVPNGSAEVWLDLPEGATVGDALCALNIVTEERLIIGVDRAYATPQTPLHDNAELTLVTPMMGGEGPGCAFREDHATPRNAERATNKTGED
jgi:molybdopterin converting factor small subunit